VRFPREVSLQLPALQRETLHEIWKREPDTHPSELVEYLLARGIMIKLANYKAASDECAHDEPASIEGGALVPECVQLQLDLELREGVSRAARDRPDMDLHNFLTLLIELGLDTYVDDLQIVTPMVSTGPGEAP
jgi:hypothetical protein